MTNDYSLVICNEWACCSLIYLMLYLASYYVALLEMIL